MPKTSVDQWDPAAANNLDVGGISIAEGCAMANLNNGMREIMAQIKAYNPPSPTILTTLQGKGADVASAATISLGDGSYFHITGTTSITDIDYATAQNGREAVLIFDGILTLTHNATTLILPGGVSIVTAAGDRCTVIQDSSDNVIVTDYTRASGASLSGSSSGTLAAWGRITTSGGVPAIGDSFNITSISDNGTGQYGINVDTNFATANYAVALAVDGSTSTTTVRGIAFDNLAVGSFNVKVIDEGASTVDPPGFTFMCAGDQ